jgi:hypothetical protein
MGRLCCPVGYDTSLEVSILAVPSHSHLKQVVGACETSLPCCTFVLAGDVRLGSLEQFLWQSAELDRLRAQTPETLPDVPENMDPQSMKFFGPMTKPTKLDRTIPVLSVGLLNETEHGAETRAIGSDSVDHNFSC